MDLITSLSRKTVNSITKYDLINQTFTKSDYEYIENLIKKYRHRDIKINEALIKELSEHGAMIFYGELFKYLIVLSIAYCFNILLPTFLIMNIFSSLRSLAGGVHMSSFNKCFAVMIIFFLSLGYVVTQAYLSSLIVIIGIMLGAIWSMAVALKYAPQERADKSDKDCDNGNKKKYMVVIFIVISFIISMVFIQNKIICLSISTGVLLEMFTITSIGTKIFKWIDNEEVIK